MGLKIFEIKEHCTACGACVSVCPQGALTLEPEKHFGFYYPVLNSDKCIVCHLCEKTCHVLSEVKGDYTERKPFMIKAKEKDLLKKSSSGGAFSLLSDIILANNGVVYGAAYDYEQEKLVEASTETVTMDTLRKSKYIESYCGSVFSDVEKNLRDNRDVLFCGTPCQVKGLYHYVRQKKCPTEHLILVQFLCHGVPSNTFFTEYKHWLEERCKGKISAMDFRSKKYGWRTPYYYYYYGHGSKTVRGDATYYMSAFFKYYMLRDSCYGCTIFDQGYADITIADFWGLFRYDPSNKDNEGISLLIAHNDKGSMAIEELKDVSTLKKELPISAIDYTRKPHRHVQESLKRKRMMEREIAQQGYMPFMEKKLKKDVRKAILKDRIGKILFALGLWKINK